jgi:hypothetical protein
MAGRGWFSSALALALLAPLAAAGQERAVYADPRGRFTITHDPAVWRVLPNFVSAAEMFCVSERCRGEGASQCSLALSDREAGATDDTAALAALIGGALKTQEPVDVAGILSVGPSADGFRRKAGSVDWVFSRLDVTIGPFRPIGVGVGIGIAPDRLLLLECSVAITRWPAMIDALPPLLDGIAITSP